MKRKDCKREKIPHKIYGYFMCSLRFVVLVSSVGNGTKTKHYELFFIKENNWFSTLKVHAFSSYDIESFKWNSDYNNMISLLNNNNQEMAKIKSINLSFTPLFLFLRLFFFWIYFDSDGNIYFILPHWIRLIITLFIYLYRCLCMRLCTRRFMCKL